MTNAEINIACAVHLGIEPRRMWRYALDSSGVRFACAYTSQIDAEKCRLNQMQQWDDVWKGKCEIGQVEQYDEWSYAPKYATSADAALTLCEAMAGEWWSCTIDRSLPLFQWECNFRRAATKASPPECVETLPRGGGLEHHEHTAETLPLAICGAFLKARNLWKEKPIDWDAVERAGWLARKWTQTIQPYQFGEPFQKRTCLWLKGLSALKPTNIITERKKACWLASPGPERWKERSRFYEGIAKAMSEQWTVQQLNRKAA